MKIILYLLACFLIGVLGGNLLVRYGTSFLKTIIILALTMLVVFCFITVFNILERS